MPSDQNFEDELQLLKGDRKIWAHPHAAPEMVDKHGWRYANPTDGPRLARARILRLTRIETLAWHESEQRELARTLEPFAAIAAILQLAETFVPPRDIRVHERIVLRLRAARAVRTRAINRNRRVWDLLSLPVALHRALDEELSERLVYRSTVKRRGWSDSMIDLYLGEPDKRVRNPHHRSGASAQLFRLDRVIECEERPAIAAVLASGTIRRTKLRVYR